MSKIKSYNTYVSAYHSSWYTLGDMLGLGTAIMVFLVLLVSLLLTVPF